MKVKKFMKPHEEWLYKAMNDLESANLLMTSKTILYDNVVYHCQQAAEKSLKAFLQYNNRKIEKVHSLIMLIKMCEEYDTSFSTLRIAAGYLNPYSTAFRYPSDYLQPSLQETRSAIEYAESVCSFIKDIIGLPPLVQID